MSTVSSPTLPPDTRPADPQSPGRPDDEVQAAPAEVRRASLRSLFGYVLAQRGLVVLVVALSLVTAAVALAQPLVVGAIIERVGASEPTARLLGLLAVLVVVGGVLGGVQQYLVQRTAEGAVRSARLRLVAHILRLPVPELDRRRVGDLVSRVSSDTGVVRAMLTQGFVESVAGVFTLVGAMVAMLLIDPLLLGVAFLVSILAVVVVVSVTSKIERASVALQGAVGDLAASVDRAIRAVRTIRAANATDSEVAAVQQDVERTWQVGLRVARVTALVAPASSIAMHVCFFAVLGLGGLRVASGSVTIAELVSFILFLFLMIMPLGQLFGTVSAVGEALGGMGRIEEVLELPVEDDEATGPVAELPTSGRIELENVSFSYAGDDPASAAVLDKVSFVVEPGQRVAVVGPSGAGKSTILSLLVRFYDPSSGVVRFGGRDVRELSRSQVRSAIGYVEQDSPALAGTLRDNLLLARRGASDEECREVLDQVNLLGVLDRSPLGLDAQVGESGVLLSGGERQRMAVARALLGRPRVLLLDESTSNLDGLNESRLRETVDRAAQGCTLVVVAHRLSTVVDSDLILVLDGGRLVASGTHAELLDRSALYRSLAEQQLLA